MNKYIPSLYYIVYSRLRGHSFLYEFYFKNKKTLDIGCGKGEFLKYDKKHIVGVDSNLRVIEKLNKMII